MARKRIKMKKIRDIIKLKSKTDMSERQIARALNVSRPVVSEYWKSFIRSKMSFKQIIELSDSELKKMFEKPKTEKDTAYKKLSKYFPYFVKELGKKGVTLQLLWHEYKEKHPEGYEYSQFCYHFQMWRNASEVRMHIVHKAGDKMFVDYAGTKMSFIDYKTGKEIPVEVFVAILGYSGLTYAEASISQEKQEWIRSNERALRYFGGVVKAIVPDNLKSGVTRSDPYEPTINPTYDDFADYYGTVIIPARVRKARDKALVENAVRLIYMRIYAVLRNRKFYSLCELNKAIRDLLDKHNNTPFQRLSYSRRDLFEEVEKSALRPLPASPYPLKHIKMATVQINYHVELRDDKHYYSVPHWIKRRAEKTVVKMVYDERIVAIYYENVRIAQHMRDKTPNGYSTIPQHMPSHHRFYAEWSADRIIRWGSSYGNEVVEVLKRIIKMRKHPEQAFKVCLGILNLAKKHGANRLEKACKKANQYGIYSLKRIQNMLLLMKEQEKQPGLFCEKALPIHENIRGSSYYN